MNVVFSFYYFYFTDKKILSIAHIIYCTYYLLQGLLTISPYHSDRLLLSKPALAGLLATIVCGLDFKAFLSSKWHLLLFCLAPAMNPRMVLTVDENGNHLPTEVRVGQAVDTVGQAGKPNTITGFQTHSTPVLLSAKERAVVADESYVPLTSVLESMVVLRHNPAGAKSKEDKQREKDRRLKLGAAPKTRSDLTWG